MGELSRRVFLKGALGTTASAGTALTTRRLNRRALAPARRSPLTTTSPGPFVLCTLYGGNDGMNTVVPYDEGAYKSLRGDLAITDSEALPLGELDGMQLGLHPSLQTMHALWGAGQLAIILGVEYPDPNYSHFASMDIWQTADLSGDAGSGWVGRWLDITGTDPMRALTVGSEVPMAFAGNLQQAGTLADSTNGNSQLPNGNPMFVAAYKKMMKRQKHEPQIASAISLNGTNLLTVGDETANALNHETPPSAPSGRNGGDIQNQFDIVAELIEYGLPTKAYGVSLQSFDTHADQANTHAGLLSQLDTGLESFFSVFPSAESGKNPVVMIHSEFGRTPHANASAGTDHGSASVAFVAGPSVKGGFYGAMPSLTKFDEYGTFLVTTDFRAMYTTVLQEVFGVDGKRILGKSFRPIPFL